MTCKRCRKDFEGAKPSCPHCGEQNGTASGVFQTSTVLISERGRDRVYRSVKDVPARLRARLQSSTSGSNAATIMIADRRGRQEITKAMRNQPAPSQRRVLHSILSGERPADGRAWLTPARRKTIMAVVLSVVLTVIALAFLHRWQ